MNTLKAIKASMIIMGVLIMVGFGLIINKIAQKNQLGNLKDKSDGVEINLTTSQSISFMTPCGAFVCVLATGAPRENHLFVINPENGAVVQTIKFMNKD